MSQYVEDIHLRRIMLCARESETAVAIFGFDRADFVLGCVRTTAKDLLVSPM
jgi:hypothetical protein